MFMYIWEDADELTNRYHTEGTCFVVAKTLSEARDLLQYEVRPYGGLKTDSDVFIKDPTHAIPVAKSWSKNLVIIAPNAGCC